MLGIQIVIVLCELLIIIRFTLGECWIRLLKTAPEEDVSAYEKLLAILVRKCWQKCKESLESLKLYVVTVSTLDLKRPMFRTLMYILFIIKYHLVGT